MSSSGPRVAPAHLPASSAERERARRASTRRLHLSTTGPWERLVAGHPEGARQGYLKEQLALASRLATGMASMLDPGEIVQAVADELHNTFGIYLVVIQRLDDDGILRVVGSAGPLGEVMREFLLFEQPVGVGVNGRVARSAQPALVPDTRTDPDYVVRDPETDPSSELAVPILVEGRVWGVLNLEEVRVGAFGDDDAILAELVAAQLGATLHRCRLYSELDGAFTTTLQVLSSAMGAKDAYTASHEDRVAELAVRVAERMGLSRHEQEKVRYAALLHDIGKIAVPDRILGKPGKLDEEEWAVMRTHTVVGADLLKRIPFFAGVHPLVRSSHERWDGGGYPDGLASEAIPLGARIVAACDALHAITSDRTYRLASSQEDALAELTRCAGTHFDPAVVEALRAELV
jgi:putative nucleotidyltransferase with HDIG domain